MAGIPPPPPGFTLDNGGGPPPPPPGFTLDAPEAPANVPMALKDAEAEVLRQARAGVPAGDIRAFTQTLRNPENPDVLYNFGPELESVVEQIQGGYQGPVNVVDTTRGDNLGATMRGGLDALTLDNADEIQAKLQAAFGDGTYDEYVREARGQRTIDATANSDERMLGQALGYLGSAALPTSRLLQAPTLGGKMVRGSAAGAVAGGIGGVGASQSMEEAGNRLPTDVLFGAGLGATFPLAAAVPGALASGVSSSRKALDTLKELGISPAMLRAEYEAQKTATGRAPALAEVLGPTVGPRLRPSLQAAPDTRDSAVNLTQEAQRRLMTGTVERTAPRSKAAQDMFDNADRRGDIEFERFRDEAVDLPETDRIFLAGSVLEEPGALGALKKSDQARITEAVAMGQIKAGDLDLLRRGLRKLSRTDLGVSYQTLAEQVEGIITNAVPEASRAVKNYARRMSRAEGVEKVGNKALTMPRQDFAAARNRPEMQNPSGISGADRALLATMPPKDRGRLARQGGARIGAAGAVAAEAGRNTRASYHLAAQLEQDSNAAANIRLAMGDKEANDLIRYVTAEKRAIDSLAALAGMPAERVATLQDDFALGVDIAASATGKAGAGFLAGVTNHVVKSLGIGQGPARKLAGMLFEPGQAENVLRKLEADGSRWRVPDRFKNDPKAQQVQKLLNTYAISPDKLKQVTKDALFIASTQLGKDNTRPPEGMITVEPNQ